jgi:hypothetical protein
MAPETVRFAPNSEDHVAVDDRTAGQLITVTDGRPALSRGGTGVTALGRAHDDR